MTLSQPASAERGYDPCLQIQADLSAMLDGELEAGLVRRVMVHSDVCPQCRDFLRSIRAHARANRELNAIATDARPGAALLREKLTENREKLSRILYELGRGFVLMGLSEEFSREVAKEPVPVPDMAMRGRNFLDEVQRWAAGSGADFGQEWVAAKDLFEHGLIKSQAERLSKGQRLLSECLALEPVHHEARIYLGLVHHVRGQRALARKRFAEVLADSKDKSTVGYALLNLANVHLDEGDYEGAVDLLLRLVESGVVPAQPRFGMAYFNLALAYGLLGRFQDSCQWFRKLHDSMPHKRSVIARELSRRSQFVHLLRSHPEIEQLFAADFPSWFPLRTREAS